MTQLQPASERPPRLVLRFAFYTAMAFALAALGILWYLQREATDQAEERLFAHASFVADSVLAHSLKPADVERPVDGARLAQLDALFRERVLGSNVLRVKIWNRDGTVVYSSDHSLIGRRAAVGELAASLAGMPKREISHLNPEGGAGSDVKVLETYVPLRLAGSRDTVGVFEISDDYAPVASAAHKRVTAIGVALGLALLLLYAALLPILRQVTKTLAARNQRLSEHGDALRRALDERSAVERKLGQAERQYRTLIEQLPLVTYIDKLDDTSSAIYISPQAEELLGYPTVAWLGDPEFFPKVLHPDDRERVLAEHRRTFTDGSSFSSEYRLIAKDGRVVWVEDQVMVARDEQNRPLHAQGFLIDVTERKLAEEARRESDEKFQTLVTNVPGAIFRAYHDEHWTMLYISDAVEDISGYPAIDFIDNRVRSFAGIVHPDDQGGEALVAEAIRDRKPYTVEYRILHADGSVRWVLERGKGVGRVDGMPLVEGAIFDVTERKLAEEARRESEEKFKALVSNVPGAIFRCAFDADWTMEFLSAAVEEITGYPPSDFVDSRVRTYASIVHPDDAVMLEEAVGDGAPYSVEYRILHADGSVRWVLERGQAVQGGGSVWLEGAIFDVTEQKGVESERLKLAAIVESSDDAIMSGSPHGYFTSWNSGAERMFGYTAKEMIGQPVALLTPADREGEAQERVQEVIRTGKVVHVETVRQRRDGSLLDVAFTYSPVRDADGEIVGISAIAQDISERKRAEAEREAALESAENARAAAEAAQRDLAAQNERLRELDKLKDEFIALVSHELRTPLTSIRGYTELLLDGAVGDLSAEQRQFLGVVERNSHRLLHLVGDLLFLAQIEAGKLVLDVGALDLASAASESVEAARPVAEEREITLTLATSPVPLLAADRARIGQLLDNLVSNAVKFTPVGGRVDIRVRALKGRAVIEVRDSGIGIPKDEQKFLFQRFFRTSTATEQAIQGTGLGLAISKAIVEAHGGAISVQSEEGAGTTFRVTLPVQQQALEPQPAEVAL